MPIKKKDTDKYYAVEFSGVYRVYANSPQDAKEKWCDANFGEGEDLDITEIREA